MTDRTPQESAEPQAPAEPDWKRKQRLAEIFGDVLPSTTRDEREPGTPRPSAGKSGEGLTASEKWLLSQVPPHHGGHG